MFDKRKQIDREIRIVVNYPVSDIGIPEEEYISQIVQNLFAPNFIKLTE